jgi:chemotaxis protein MotB
MSNIDERRFNDSFISVQKALMGKDTSPALMKVNQTDSGAILDQIQMSRQLIKEQGEIFSDFTFFQNTKGLEGVIGGTFDKGVITLRLPAGVLFAPGSARVDEEGQQLLLQLRDFFIRHPDQTINIRGFTDDIPPGPGSRYRDNWELSAMRAVNVLRTLMAYDIDPGRMTATGLADMEPLYPNTSPENRARNRRIEIQLERRVGG